jgi:hypothetical protein
MLDLVYLSLRRDRHMSVSRLDLDLLELGHFGFFRSRISCKAWDTLSLLFTCLVGASGPCCLSCEHNTDPSFLQLTPVHSGSQL